MENVIRADAIRKAILTLPQVAEWPEIISLFPEEDADEPVRLDWQLPVLACRATGGRAEAGHPAAAAIACLQISIILADDMLDQDPRGEHHRLGSGRTANLALAFQAAALALLAQAPASPAARAAAAETLAIAALGTAYGQELDVQNLPGEENYWRVVRAKSTPFYGAALKVGALLGEASSQVAQGLYEFGVLLGEMIQIFDDLVDAFQSPANADWRQGRNNLTLLYATQADHPQRDALVGMLPRVSDPQVLSEAQQVLITSGAVSYCVYLWIQRYRRARIMLDSLSLLDSAPMREVLALQIDPLVRWLPTVGVPLPPELLEIH